MTRPALVLRRCRTCHRGKCVGLADVELLGLMVLRDVRIWSGEDNGRSVFWVETSQNLLWRNRRIAERFRKALLTAVDVAQPTFFEREGAGAPLSDTLKQPGELK